MPVGATYTFAQATIAQTVIALVPTGLIDPVIVNLDATTVMVGASSVTASSGYPIRPGMPGERIPWVGKEALCAVAPAGSQDVRYRVALVGPGL